eukprot:482566_1
MALNYSFVVTWSYFIIYVAAILIGSIVCAVEVYNRKEYNSQYSRVQTSDSQQRPVTFRSKKEIVKRWAKLLWQKKSVYFQLLPHFFDQATDFGVLVEYYSLRNVDIGINTMHLFIISIFVIVLHRIITSMAIYKLTRNKTFVFYQLLDILVIRCIWTNYKLRSDQPSNAQRYLQSLEATFEGGPQILISTAFLIKASTYKASPIVIISLIASFWTLTARVSADDKVMCKEEWESPIYQDYFNCKWIRRVFAWRFLEISCRIILLLLIWINLGGISVIILFGIEFIYLFIICLGLGTIDMMGNIIYLMAANSNATSKKWAFQMTYKFWIYRVISSYIFLIICTIFAMTDFDAPMIENYSTRHHQTLQNDICLALFIYCWIATPIWQLSGAIIVFDHGNIMSIGRDIDQLIVDGQLNEALELISFGAHFDAEKILKWLCRQRSVNGKFRNRNSSNRALFEQIFLICLEKLDDKCNFQEIIYYGCAGSNNSTYQLAHSLCKEVNVVIDPDIDFNEIKQSDNMDIEIEPKKETKDTEKPITWGGYYIAEVENFASSIIFSLIISLFVCSKDIVILIIQNNNDYNCDNTINHGSTFISFGVSDFLLIGCILHIVIITIIIQLIFHFVYLGGDEDRAGCSVMCGCGCLFFFAWSVIGFLLYSEMDTIHTNKQCGDMVLSWSILTLCEIVLLCVSLLIM